MALNQYENYGNSCIHSSLPPCSVSCPFNLDIRGFTEKVKNGKYNSAYKIFRDKTVFPALVCKLCSAPCETVCFRNGTDSAVSLIELERSVLAHTKKKDPLRINLPPRTEHVTIIGAGLTGLTCAFRLASRKYNVTVYEKTDRIGGALHEKMPTEDFLPEIEFQLREVKINYVFNREIKSLEEIEDEAILIATGEGGPDFGLKEDYDPNSFGTVKPGVFIAGGVIGADPVLGIAQGNVCANSLSAYLQIWRNDGMPNSFLIRTTPITREMVKPVRQEPVVSPDGTPLSKEDAATEAGRCMQCDCNLCKDCCELFDEFGSLPGEMAADAVLEDDVNKLVRKKTTHRMSSCNLCGLCAEVCPAGIDISKVFEDFRHRKFEDGTYHKRYNDFFLRDMEHALTEGALKKSPPGEQQSEYMFFPGCQLGASNPETVYKTYEKLLQIEKKTSLLLTCCGVPADWAGNRTLADQITEEIRVFWKAQGEPTVVLACTSCKAQFEKCLPEIRTVTVYELFAGHLEYLNMAQRLFGTLSVFDPCAARHMKEVQEAVRTLAKAQGAKLEELEFSGQKARCCGWGGHTMSANAELTEQYIRNHSAEKDNPYIVYCSNCRDNFISYGKDCVHILDVMLDTVKEKPISLQQRRQNRIDLKHAICRGLFGEEEKGLADMHKDTDALIIPDDVRKAMNRRLILDEDVMQVIRHAEDTGWKILDPESGLFISHLQIGIATYWVVYRDLDDGKYEVYDAYLHHMEIEEGQNDE